MRILVLEDDPSRQRKFMRNYGVSNIVIMTKTVKECLWALRSSPDKFDIVFLDHDLGGEVMVESGPGTGYEVACWLEQNPKSRPKCIVIHSFNPDGAARMSAALPEAVKWPGVWLMGADEVLKNLKENGWMK